MIENREAASVEARQTILASDPQIPIASLDDLPNPITGRQPMLVLPRALLKLEGDLAGINDPGFCPATGRR
jgi:hypothetical protein